MKKAAISAAAQDKLFNFHIPLMVLVVLSALKDGNLIFISFKNNAVLLVNSDAGKTCKITFQHLHLTIRRMIAIPHHIFDQIIGSFQ